MFGPHFWGPTFRNLNTLLSIEVPSEEIPYDNGLAQYGAAGA